MVQRREADREGAAQDDQSIRERGTELCIGVTSGRNRGQVERLERVFESLDMRARGKHCEGMAGILEEGAKLIQEDGAESVLDAGFIAAAQRVEHYEITAYGSLMAWAKALGLKDALSLLKENEAEEKAADKKLTAIAESGINQAAAAGQGEREEAMAGRRK